MPEDITFADWWCEQEERAAFREESGNRADAEHAEDEVVILKRRPLAEIRANQPEPVIDGLATRRNTTLISSAGGTGKTCMMLQAAIEAALGLPVWGCAELIPRGNRWLYLNAEDQLQNIDYWLSRILPRYDLTECPIDLFPVCETKRGEFLLSAENANRLATTINAEQYDGLIVDTGIAVMPAGTRIIDPVAIRSFLRSSLGLLQRETKAAIIVGVHDNKAGQPVSGTADWLSFARLALHLETAGHNGDETTLALSTIKANLRWPFRKAILVRDPHTLTSKVTAIEHLGASGGTATTPEDVDRLLARLVRTEVIPLRSEDRTKDKVEALLFQHSRAKGVKRIQVRDFLKTRVNTEDVKLGRTHGFVVTGVRENGEPAA